MCLRGRAQEYVGTIYTYTMCVHISGMKGVWAYRDNIYIQNVST